VTDRPQPRHPDFDDFGASWDLALNADAYAPNTLLSYRRALAQHADWLAAHHPGTGPLDVGRDQIRGWLVYARESTSSGPARSWFAGVRHFYRFLVAEGELAADPTEGIRTPPPNDPSTPVLAIEEIRALLATCAGRDFLSRRDAAIILVFVDGGLRLAENAGLQLCDVDIRARVLQVRGKGSNRSGPRLRTPQLGVKAAQALDRYLRERRRHPYAELPALWLGARGRPRLSADGIERMLQRRAEAAGIKGMHPHVFRHTWASHARAAGLSEGDLMYLGGWRSRQMLDRYGKAVAAERAREAYGRLALGDRL
jgi:site-specific recombinase XerD